MKNINTDQNEVVKTKLSPLHTVTPLSKYLAMGLFIVLPFIGGWLGFQYGKTNTAIEESALTPQDTPVSSSVANDSAQIEASAQTTASLTTITKEVFPLWVDPVAGNGEIREFDVVSVTTENETYIISYDNGEPLLLVKGYEVSPSGKFVYVITQESVGEPEISIYIHEVTSKALHTLSLTDFIGDDEFLYPNEILSIDWLPDNRLQVKSDTGVKIVSISPETPWLLQVDKNINEPVVLDDVIRYPAKVVFSLESRDGNDIDCVIISHLSNWYPTNECYRHDLNEDYAIIAEYAGCGGCERFYRVDNSSNRITKLVNVPFFESELLNKSPITDYYIGISYDEIFTYDFKTDTREKITSTNDPQIGLLDCGHGCNLLDGAEIFISIDSKRPILRLKVLEYRTEAQQRHQEPPTEKWKDFSLR